MDKIVIVKILGNKNDCELKLWQYFFFFKELKNNSKTKQNHTTFLNYVISWMGLGYENWPLKDMLPALWEKTVT